MFTFDQLRYFIETASHEHVGRAARALGVSPSTVSQSLTNLEAELGQPLFLRSGKAIHLNGAGVAFVTRAQSLMVQLRGLHADFAVAKGEPSGALRMAATHSLAPSMTRIWLGILERYPKLSGSLRSVLSQDVSALLADRSVDFGIRYGVAKGQPALEQVVVLETRIAVCVRSQHPLLRHPVSERFRRLKTYPVAVPRSFDPLGDDAGSPLIAVMRSPLADFVFDSYDAALSYVTRTDGWTMMPDWLFRHNRELLREVEVPKKLEGADVVATWRKDSPHAAFHAFVVQEVRRFLEKRR